MTVFLSVPFPGVSRVAEEGEKLGLWKFVRLEEGRVAIPPAETYILGAYHPFYQRLLSLGGHIGVAWTSSIGEMDFTPVEWEYLDTLLKDPRVEFIWFGDEALAKLFPQKGFHAPYPLAPMEPIQVEKQDIITLFCPSGPKKNIPNQIAAAALLQKKVGLILHTNVAAYEPLMKLFGLRYVLHSWLPREEYNSLLARARINLAVSWSETFNYNVAEAALLGVLSAVGPAVAWMPFWSKVDNLNDPLDIAERVLWLLNLKEPIRDYVLGVATRQEVALRAALTAHGLLSG